MVQERGHRREGYVESLDYRCYQQLWASRREPSVQRRKRGRAQSPGIHSHLSSRRGGGASKGSQEGVTWEVGVGPGSLREAKGKSDHLYQMCRKFP